MATSVLSVGNLKFTSDGTTSLVTMTATDGILTLDTTRIKGLTDPADSQDAATKAYVDSVATGLSVRGSVRAATTAAVTLASALENSDSIDGVTLATGDRILVKDQSEGKENGIYVVNASGVPTRATDFDANADVTSGAFTFVKEGTTNADQGFVLTTNDGSGIQIGTTALSFSQFSSTSSTFASIDVNGGAIDGTAIGAASASTGAFTTLTASTSLDVTGSAGIILENDETITNSTDGTVLINGVVAAGTGSGAGVFQSSGDQDLTLQTGNSTTGSITITDGANGNVAITPNGTGQVVISTSLDVAGSGGISLENEETITNSVDGTVLINGIVAAGTGSGVGVFQSHGDQDLTLQTGNSTTGSITITDGADGNISITPNGSGEVDISKVDIDGGAIDGTVIGANSAAAGTFTTASAATFTSTSDARLKQDVTELEGALGKLKSVRGVHFTWKESGKADTGVIAQEVEEVLPHAVHTREEDGIKQVDYGKLAPLLIQAIKEQQAQIAELTARLAAVEARA